MKVILLGDTHFGVRNDSPLFAQMQKSFFYDCLFPYMKEHNITRIVQLGDFGDKRKGMSFITKQLVNDILTDSYTDYGIAWDLFHGNHDQYHRNDGSITFQNQLLLNMPNVTVHQGITTITLDGVSIDLFPWINSKDMAEVESFVQSTTSNYACGHFEFSGFDMHAGVPASGGMNHQMFKRYDKVWSGHFHTQSQQDNIHYIGTPYDLTWTDYPDTKGFHVFNTNKGDTTFVQNPTKLHIKVEYSSDNNLDSYCYEEYTGKLVKLIVYDRTDADKLDKVMTNIQNACPANLTVIDTDFGAVDVDIDLDELDVTDTFSIISQYADEIDNDSINKEVLKHQLHKLYQEALLKGNEL